MLKYKIVKMYQVQIVNEDGNIVRLPNDYCEPEEELARIEVSGNREKAEKAAKELLEYTRVKLGRK